MLLNSLQCTGQSTHKELLDNKCPYASLRNPDTDNSIELDRILLSLNFMSAFWQVAQPQSGRSPPAPASG